MKFALDTPQTNHLNGTTRFSGWCLGNDGQPADRIILRADGSDFCQLERTHRWDLQAAFSEFPESVLGGFAGELVIPPGHIPGRKIRLELVACVGTKRHRLLQADYFANPSSASPARPRSFNLGAILEHVPMQVHGFQPPDTPRSWPALVLGVPHFHAVGDIPSLRMQERGPTNAYSADALEVMDSIPGDGLFLDLGCGIRRDEDMRSNGVYLDAVHFRSVDVVCTQPRLPFHPQCFDAVISLGVFEHLPDPFAMATEIHRILKPGGTVWIETAFMQPMHADPGHYFNMTREGMLRVFHQFEIDACGIQSHQMPSYSLQMQIAQALAYIRDGEWKTDLENLMSRLKSQGHALNDALGPIGRRNLAAGFFLRGRRSA